jgi:hypothetical protein
MPASLVLSRLCAAGKHQHLGDSRVYTSATDDPPVDRLTATHPRASPYEHAHDHEVDTTTLEWTAALDTEPQGRVADEASNGIYLVKNRFGTVLTRSSEV